jgi:tRNA A-37 threonylcarbamoyl transferase component Bud32
MPLDPTPIPDLEQLLERAVTSFVKATEAGDRPDRDVWLARYPQIADELEEFFAGQDRLEGMAAPLRAAVVTPSRPLPAPFGDYELLEEVGRGGMGVVYKARQHSPDRLVALKMIRAGALASNDELQRFQVEANAAAGLDHPHIVAIHEVGECDRQRYFTMTWVSHGSLAQAVSSGQWPACTKTMQRQAATLVVKIARAVLHAHERGILHRDLKPSNILVDAAGEPHVTDFGLAKRLEQDSGLTQSGAVVGTPSYMAPEQAAGQQAKITTVTDVYGLGAILYVLLTGQPPFQSDLPHDTLRQVQEQEPKLPRAINPQVDRDLETICLKCLNKEPERRYGSAAALAEDLERWLAGEPIQARPISRLERWRRWCQRKPLVAGLSAFSVLLVFGGFVGLTVSNWKIAQKEVEARTAEQHAQDLLADSYVQLTRLAIQRGAWQDALLFIDKALATERHADSIPLRLDKIRALIAVDDVGRYVPEIEALAARPNLGEHEGAVLLLQGEIQLGRDDAQGERLIRRAREIGLSPAADAYAQALLAETTPEAVKHLRRTLALDPYQPRARATLELLLILLARLPEARIELAAHDALFPDDMKAKSLRAILLALEGDLPAANVVADEMRGHEPDVNVETLRILAELVAEFRNPANRPSPDSGLPNLTGPFLKQAPKLSRLWKVRPGADLNDIVTALPSLHGFLIPRVQRQFNVRVIALVRNSGLLPSRDQIIDFLTWVGKVHPEGTILASRAIMLFDSRRYAEAERASLEAAETPGWLLVRRPALCFAFKAQVALADSRSRAVLAASSVGLMGSPHAQSLLLAASAIALERANLALWHRPAETLRKLLALGPAEPPLERDQAIRVALLAEKYTLARQLLDNWERQAPTDLQASSWRAITEMRAKSYGRALEAAEKVLKRKPGDAAMRAIKRQATEKLVEQARPLIPAVPEKRMP